MSIETIKILVDCYYFKEGLEVTSPTQLYKLSDNTYWFVPSATITNPYTLTFAPMNNPDIKQYFKVKPRRITWGGSW